MSKPNTFSWSSTKLSGGAFNLTATDWNDLQDTINLMRDYLGLSEYDFTRAVKGETFTALMYNEVREAIQGFGYDAGSYIPEVSIGDTITAEIINVLVTELNSAINNL